MNNVIDITKQVKAKVNKEQMNKQLFDIAELINAGYIKEIIGILVDNDENYYPIMPYENIKVVDFKKILDEYIDKVPKD
ncbi:hypothetical protein Ccar_25925 (plasmid) [Clostridium carboxidivorans P7]|uniref:Uncharacterized protein n=2 Tax=Clostridium TaxID=1485 RepID=C6PZY1_9CLOT|nr:hypothetical protein [Clostridium carboxidivorans]ADO12133.1 hypothetical protein Ccar_4293 [Clostridium carboxidivorans P7]AKN34268.1 hypothetical protein Ccar_25925 [Clostridium carboxidivorans P7]EET85191.1 hypothetical protein CcarbDRAFT_4348 [Clostridium carboxidivorans P7]EFG87533.1 hypothetical protein CLCAR_3068 [Clostridium carboxidivorans P7]